MNNLAGEMAASTDWWVRPDHVFCGEILSSDKAIRIFNGRVSQVADRQNVPLGATVLDVEGCVSAGFFDIQINGGGGVLFNGTPTVAALNSIAKAHRNFGTTALLPTVITDSPNVLRKAAIAVVEAHGKNGILGLHVEGPHISAGRRGTHLAKFVRPFDQETSDVIRQLRQENVPVLMTVAPESVSPKQVADLVSDGVVVSIGHSDASKRQTDDLVAAGATAFTHLFNAMSPMLNRSPGVTGAAINSTAYCSFICDGIHVDDEMLKLAIRARPIPDRMILISDAMPTVGGPDFFELYGQKLTLNDGSLVNQEGSLAGAHTTMAQSFARVIERLGVSFEDALRMAISNPARLMGISDYLMLQGTSLSDLIVISPEFECQFLADAGQSVPQ